MSEIEKMYNNANLTSLYCGDDYVASSGLEFECTDGNKEKCKTCDKVKTNYPQFTAEKQLELIKWLSKECSYKITLNFVSDEHRITIDKHRELGKFCQKCDGCFEQALAGLINNLWQDLTEEEKQQVKGILE